MERSLERLRQAVEQSKEDYIHKLDSQWLATVNDQYRGHSIKEIFGGSIKNPDPDGPETINVDAGWDGSLSDADVNKLADYIEEPTQFLIIQGPSGTGKSTLAATIGRKLVHELEISAAFINSVTLINEFSFRNEHEDPVKHFASFGLLVIDDLGAVNEALTPHQQKALWNLIESRWSKTNKLTIITTNMAIQTSNSQGLGLSSWIGESGWDRISSSLTRVNATGESFR
jgi:DNA replication protein DnaC